jgi:FkbM family methyltransferase
MNKWFNRAMKVGAALKGGGRYLPMRGLPGTTIRIPLAAHRGFWPGAMPDADLVSFLAQALPPDGVFLDVGANVGTYSAAVAVAKGGRVRGAAFEPVPTTHALLRRTMELNGMDGFRAEAVALSSRSEALHLTGHGGGGNNFIVPAGDARGQVNARGVTLDDWVEAHPDLAPGAMKIDVEGFELEVLRGARSVLTRFKPALVIECHCASWPAAGVKAADVAVLLHDCGYPVLVDRRGAEVDLAASERTIHVLCKPIVAA